MKRDEMAAQVFLQKLPQIPTIRESGEVTDHQYRQRVFDAAVDAHTIADIFEDAKRHHRALKR